MKEQLAVPKAEFRSYYGRPILKKPEWDWKIAGVPVLGWGVGGFGDAGRRGAA